MRDPITEDAVLDQEETLAGGSPKKHREYAELLASWASEPHPEDEVTPGDLVVLAGEHLELAGELAAAEDAYRRAIALDDWDRDLDPRALLARLLLKDGRMDEAVAIDGQLRRSVPAEALTYLFMAEAWEEHGDARKALGWFTRGLVFDERTGAFDELEVQLIRVGRWRVREAQGMEPDEDDQEAMAIQESWLK